MFDAARVGVMFAKKVVETAGKVELLRYFAAENGQVHDEASAQFSLCDGSSLAHVLRIGAGEELLPHQWNAEIRFGHISRRIGQRVSGGEAPGLL